MSGDSSIDFNKLLGKYGDMTKNVDAAVTSIGGTSAANVQMQKLFKLQMAMNVLSMFGTTLTSVIQGIQDIAMSIARNTKGS